MKLFKGIKSHTLLRAKFRYEYYVIILRKIQSDNFIYYQCIKYDMKETLIKRSVIPEHECSECGAIVPPQVVIEAPEGTSLKEVLQGYPDEPENFTLKNVTCYNRSKFADGVCPEERIDMIPIRDVAKAKAEILRRIMELPLQRPANKYSIPSEDARLIATSFKKASQEIIEDVLP